MIRTSLVVGWIVVALGMAAAQSQAPESVSTPGGPVVTEVQRLKAQNLQLKLALIETQRRELDHATAKLQDEARALEAELRALLKPPADHVLNWTTLIFAPATSPEKATPK